MESATWWSELLEVKDTLPLPELAQRFRVPPEALAATLRRTQTKRQPYRRPAHHKVSPAKPVKSRVSRGGRRVGGRSKLDPFRDAIGTAPDGEIAQRAGVSRSAVRAYRKRHGIRAHRRADAQAQPSQRVWQIHWVDRSVRPPKKHSALLIASTLTRAAECAEERFGSMLTQICYAGELLT